MEKELIKEIATQVVNESLIYNWKLYVLIVSLFLISIAISSFVKSYFGKRGEQLARKSDLDIVIQELRKTTITAESIKTSIEKDTWIKKEFNILRRQKLEELLLLMYKYKEESNIETKESIIASNDFSRDTSIGRITILHKLYFPELDEEMSGFYLAFSASSEWQSQALQQKAEKMKQNLSPLMDDNHFSLYPEIYSRIVNSIMVVENKAKIVMSDLRFI
jgi:hypothetical protein